jgi:hypothetical protein
MQKILCSMMAIALLLAVCAPAQTGSSLVAGAVADSTNRVIPGASVTLTNEASAEQRTAITNEIGEFVFPGVAPGAYTVRVHAAGFRVLELKGNVVLSSTRLAVGTLRLEVGSVNESVEVTAQTSMVQTDSSEKSELVSGASYGGIPTSFSAAAVSFDGREPLSGYDSNLAGKDDSTYTYGPHTFKAGFFFEHSRFGQTATSNFSGNADFGQNSLDPTNTGYAFANAYVGHFNQYTEDLGRGPDNARQCIFRTPGRSAAI